MEQTILTDKQQLLKVDEVKDYPRMLIALPDEEWKNFWFKEAKKLKEEVLE